jgi:uncharacterized membrane protein YphA (DoxX/SURF4 family)
MDSFCNTAFMLFMVRAILGILFFFQGYDKLFRVKITGVVSYFREETRGRNVPGWVLSLSAWYTSLAEFLGGGLLIIGLFKTWSYYVLGIDLILVCGAFSLLKPMWDMQLLFPRLVMLVFLVYFPSEMDCWSADYWLGLN